MPHVVDVAVIAIIAVIVDSQIKTEKTMETNQFHNFFLNETTLTRVCIVHADDAVLCRVQYVHIASQSL